LRLVNVMSVLFRVDVGGGAGCPGRNAALAEATCSTSTPSTNNRSAATREPRRTMTPPYIWGGGRAIMRASPRRGYTHPCRCESVQITFAPAMWALRRTIVVAWCVLVVAAVAVPPVASARRTTGNRCAAVLGRAAVTGPTRTTAWRAEIAARTAVFDRLPRRSLRPSRWLTPTDALWLMVLARPRVARDRCWVRLRLPWRPDNAAGWVNARNVVVQRNRWRIQVSTSRRTLTLFRFGKPVRSLSVVVGKPGTPTPSGLFAIVWAIPWNPNDFLGSWVLELTAHSNVLDHFDGGDGTVGIHGRGGASLLDPLGSARSHGCVRMANDAIDWLVHTVGEDRLLGTPVGIE
jgi:lipoprotein-anchoring transpeptidase ErfK/SrfK